MKNISALFSLALVALASTAVTSFSPPSFSVAKATEIYRARYPDTDGKGDRYCDISNQKISGGFTELKKVYGEQQALEMIRIMPIILVFKKENFAPSFKAMAEIFGTEETKGMVLRNPGLLEVGPADAATSNDQTMVFSYLVSFFRPLSSVLLPLILFLLCIPAIDAVTGLGIRSTFLHAIFG